MAVVIGPISSGAADRSARSADLLRAPFVGREAQLKAFSQVLAARRGCGFVVYGPSGVGKSRLAEECLASAVRAGFRGIRAVASAAAAVVPLGAIAHLLPDGVDLSDPAQAFADVAESLAGRGKGRRWILWVDDLHLLDAASAMLLRQLMDAGLMRVIATLRTGEEVSDAVRALCHSDAVHRVDLDELNRDETERFLESVLGGTVGRRTVHHLHEGSGGNLLYLHELVRGALDAGTLIDDGEVWRLSVASLSGTPKLTELVDMRLAAAGPAGRPVLELLAHCEPLPLADAEAMASLGVLSELERTGLIRTVENRRRTAVMFSHPLYAEVLRKQTPVLRRRKLLLEQAERMEARGARRRDDPLRIAIWRLAASGTANPDLLVQAATLSFHAHDYAQVTTLLEALPAAAHTTSSRLLLGYALIELGKWQSAERVLSVADAHVVDEKEKLEVTLARILSLFWLGERTQETLEVVDAALRQVTSRSGQRALRIIEGYVRVISGQPERGLELLEEYLEDDAHQSHDLNTWLRGALTKTLALTALGRAVEATAWGEHAYETHVRAEEEQHLVPHPATQLSHHALAESGRVRDALSVGEQAFSDLMISADTTVPRIWVAFCMGRAEWQAGHPAAARRWFAEVLAPAREIHHLRVLRLTASYLAAVAAELGDLDAATTTLADLPEYPVMGWLTGEERLGEAWVLAAQGKTAQARKVLLEAAESAGRACFFTSEALLLTEAARLGGAKDVAGRLSELAQLCEGTMTPARARFALAVAADDPDQLLSAADELGELGLDLLAAEAAAAAATALRKIGESRGVTAARNRAATWAARCDGARTPLLASTEAAAVLTEREREIAQLAARGTTSKEIAEMLSLSTRTVDNHLQHVYTKLGITNRRDLAKILST
ncbi:LuxR C-terminal-related transcriptional regulator [Streptomyces sp. NPDC056480]|uniref:helix-turn-helix transcriptional regulator n=1 Tax=Streptomyces sp. NPDC056480 TaxID=3345833 RepID=UPI0036999BA0